MPTPTPTPTPRTHPSAARLTAAAEAAASPPALARAPLSTLAIAGALTAVPVAPLGIVLCSVALSQVRRGLVRGRVLAIVGLIASITTCIIGSALSVVVASDVISVLRVIGMEAPAPTAASGAGGSGRADPVILDEIPTSCTHNRGIPYARVDWIAGPLTGTGLRAQLTASVMDSSGATVGRGTIQMDPNGGNQEGVARVPVAPDADVSSCTLTMTVVPE